MQRQGLVVGMLAVVGLCACGDVLGPQSGRPLVNVTVANAFLVGDVGYVRGINQPADDALVMQNMSGLDELDVMVESHDGNAAMVMLEFSNGLGDLVNQLGTRSGRDANLILTGCAGPTYGAWDWDEPADHTEVTVQKTATPGTYRVDFKANWLQDTWAGTPAHQVQGHFNLSVDNGEGAETASPVTSGAVSGTALGNTLQGTPDATARVAAGSRVVTSTFNAREGQPAVQLVVSLPADFNGVASFSGADAPATVVARASGVTSLADTVTLRAIPSGSQLWITYTAAWANQDAVRGSFAIAR